MSQYSLVSAAGAITPIHDLEQLRQFSVGCLEGHNVATHYFIVDIDDTLRSSEMRRHLMPTQEDFFLAGSQPNKAWTRFNDACHLDPPLQENIDKVKRLLFGRCDPVVIFLTSCTASNRSARDTKTQLLSYGFPLITDRNFHIVMRGADNQDTPLKMKLNFIKNTAFNNLYPASVTVVDDNQQIINEMQKLGFNILKV